MAINASYMEGMRRCFKILALVCLYVQIDAKDLKTSLKQRFYIICDGSGQFHVHARLFLNRSGPTFPQTALNLPDYFLDVTIFVETKES